MRRAVILMVPLVAVFASVLTAIAQSGGSYTLTWFTADGGGGNSSGGSYTLGGTMGQPDVGQMSGGSYVLKGGYWAASLGTNPSPTRTTTATKTRTRTPTKSVTRTATRTSTRTGTPGATATRTKTRTLTPTKTATLTNALGSVCQTKPASPAFKAPENNATLTTTRPMLKWNKPPCAQTYKVIVKKAETGLVVDKKGGLTVLRYKTDPLPRNIQLKLFVKACNPPFGCARSATLFFTVQ